MGQEEIHRRLEKKSVASKLDKWRLAKIFAIGLALRIIGYSYGQQWFSARPELTSPLVNFQRLEDGIALLNDGINPYDGDLVHYQPMMLHLFSKLINLPSWFLFGLFSIFDSVTAHILFSSFRHNLSPDIAWVVLKCYLLNPFTISSCAILSISSFYNLITALFVYFFLKGSFVASCVTLALLTNLCLYPVALIGSLFVRFSTTSCRIASILLVSLGCLGFVMLNYVFNGFNFNFLDATYGSMLRMDNLNPTSGVFWYFFIQVFPQFRQFYLSVCQSSLLFYVVPLTFAIRKDAHLHMFLSLLLISIFSTYPTLNYGSVYLALIPTLQKYWKQPVRFVLLLGGTMVTCVVLMPVMWHMWIVVGSGNANFYFAVTLIYNFAQIYLMIDLLFAYFRIDLLEACGDNIALKTTLTFRPHLTNYEKNK